MARPKKEMNLDEIQGVKEAATLAEEVQNFDEFKTPERLKKLNEILTMFVSGVKKKFSDAGYEIDVPNNIVAFTGGPCVRTETTLIQKDRLILGVATGQHFNKIGAVGPSFADQLEKLLGGDMSKLEKIIKSFDSENGQ